MKHTRFNPITNILYNTEQFNSTSRHDSIQQAAAGIGLGLMILLVAPLAGTSKTYKWKLSFKKLLFLKFTMDN